MMWTIQKLVFCLLFTVVLSSNVFLSTFLTSTDVARLKQVFETSLDSKDLIATHYAVIGLKELKQPVPKQNEICKFLLESIGSSPTADSYYYSGTAWKAIGNCPGTYPTANAVKVLTDVATSETSSGLAVYQAVTGLKALGQAIPQPAKIVKNVQALLKKDDSATNFGYAFHIASHLGKDGAFAYDKIEEAIVQADEVGGKYLQFEGGLSITALVVGGVYNLCTSLNKSPPLTADQAVKFSNYFISRRSVQTPKGAYLLANVINIYTTNKFHLPAVVTVVGGWRVSKEEPKLTVKLSNILGEDLPAGSQLILESAARKSDALVIASKNKFTQQSQGLFSVGMLDSKPEPGVYDVKVSITGGDPRLVGTVNIGLTVSVLASASLEQVKIGKADSDLSTQPRYETVAYPGGKLSQPLELDSMQKLSLRFQIKDKSSGKPLSVHQAFLLFTNEKTKEEITFLMETDTSAGSYKLDLDIGSRASDFGHASGLYKVNLIVGDVVLSIPFSWNLADVKIRFSEQTPPPKESLYDPKPEIKHLFREPEIRPPVFVSNMFTALCALPLLILVILWLRLGINLSNFPISLSCIGFHIGLGGIFSLFGLFWLQLNMFETLKYLSALGPFTFLCGVKTLSKLSSQKKQ